MLFRRGAAGGIRGTPHEDRPPRRILLRQDVVVLPAINLYLERVIGHLRELRWLGATVSGDYIKR